MWRATPTIPATIVTPAAALPVSIADCSTYGWDILAEDAAMVEIFLRAGIERLMELGGPVLITTTLRTYLDVWPTIGPIILPHPPLASVTSITYVDTAGTTQTWTAAEYQIDVSARPGLILPAYGYTWPSIRPQLKAITITYTAGYGAADTSVPYELKRRLMQYVKFRFDHRDQTDEDWLDSFLMKHWHGWIF